MTEAWVTERSVWPAIFGPVKGVEELSPELQVHGLPDGRALYGRDVLIVEGEGPQTRTQGWRGPERKGSIGTPSVRIEVDVPRGIEFPSREALLRLSGNHVRPSLSIEDRKWIAASNPNWTSALIGEEPAELPTAQHFSSGPLVGQVGFARTNRKFIQPAYPQDVRVVGSVNRLLQLTIVSIQRSRVEGGELGVGVADGFGHRIADEIANTVFKSLLETYL